MFRQARNATMLSPLSTSRPLQGESRVRVSRVKVTWCLRKGFLSSDGTTHSSCCHAHQLLFCLTVKELVCFILKIKLWVVYSDDLKHRGQIFKGKNKFQLCASNLWCCPARAASAINMKCCPHRTHSLHRHQQPGTLILACPRGAVMVGRKWRDSCEGMWLSKKEHWVRSQRSGLQPQTTLWMCHHEQART